MGDVFSQGLSYVSSNSVAKDDLELQAVRSAGEGAQGFDVLGKHSADRATSPAQICIYILLIQVLM